MAMTNFIFVVLLGTLMFTGIMAFVIDIQGNVNNSPIPSNSSLSNFANASIELTNNMNELNTTVLAPAVGQAQKPQLGDTGIGGALGYLFGGLTAIFTLVGDFPHLMFSFISAFMLGAGLFFPTFVLAEILLAILGIVLIGVLYYLLKVKG